MKRKCLRCKREFETEDNEAYCPECNEYLEEQTFQSYGGLNEVE